jgi:PIN domain nuclease of toxin-antitoxin system
VTYLLDTHALLWASNDDPRLGKKARAAILDESSNLMASVASAWELSIKVGSGGLQLNPNVVSWFTQATMVGRIQVLPVELSHLTELETLAKHHGDPFDRLLICQALTLDLTILTKDQAFKKYKVKTLW